MFRDSRRTRLLAPVLVALLAACVPDTPADLRPLVLVSVVPQRFAVEAIGGDLVRVDVMVPPGASPQSYEPTMRQLRQLEEAVLYVKVGHPSFPFEATWLEPLLAEVPGLRVRDASAGLPLLPDDPHLWLVPRNVEQMAESVAEALAEILPDEREALLGNLAAFRRRAGELDREIRSLLRDREGEEFFVFHPAWGYFAREYGLVQVAVEREHKEPDPHQLAQLIQHAKDSEARVIFVQPQFDPASARTVAREAGLRVESLDPLAADWDANLLRAARALAEGDER